MSKTRNLSDLLDANGDVKSTALDNVALTGIDDNADATAITIDSNENVLVGTTNSTGLSTGSSTNEGARIVNNGGIQAQRNNDSPLYLSKASGYTYDGFARFFHNGTEVGKIGTADNDLYLGTTDTGIRFNDGLNAIYPASVSTYASLDNTVNLGWSTVRWKDAYIGGNIYLGGTGSANALDDYEEGTWTPVPQSGTLQNANGFYTKIGRKVHISFFMQNPSDQTSSTNFDISGLPFAAGTGLEAYIGVCMNRHILSTNGGDLITPYLISGNNLRFYVSASNSDWNRLIHDFFNSSAAELYGSLTYFTN